MTVLTAGLTTISGALIILPCCPLNGCREVGTDGFGSPGSNNLSGTNLMSGIQISKIMKIVVLTANFDLANLIVFVTGD